jgi:outer membrane receptor protein involved in Fe transport
LGDRAHLLLSAEYYHANLVNQYGDRSWYKGYSLINNPIADAAHPSETRYLLLPNVVSSIATFGGLINSGVPTTSALYRRYFNTDGTLSPFVLGTGTATSAHSITNGGSGDDATVDLAVLAPESQRASGFAYLDFNATPNLNLYVQGLWGQSMVDQPDHGGRFANVAGIDTRITIYRENAFLPAAVRQIMINENLASFQMNVVGDREHLGRESRVRQDNKTQSGTIGFKYVFPKGLLEGWHVDGYAQYGTADNKGYQQGVLLDRISAAVDAVVDPSSGKIVCRAALQNAAKWGGCVPINLFGRGNASDAGIAYVTRFTPGQTITSPLYFQPDGYASGQSVTFTSGLGKVYNTTTKQIMGEVAANGKLFDGWAGPVALALGASYRKEEIEQIVYDPSAPASDPSIFAAVDPALRGVPPYTLGRFSMIQNSGVANVHGNYIVKEAFTELQMPLLADVWGFKRLNLLAAARYAHYTGSGGVWSWKAGLDWQVFDDLRLRGTVSRDVRAATLLERFNRTGGVGTVTKDPVFPNDGTQTFSGVTGGNPQMNPEVSKTYTYGVVYQPSWLPGASISFDYWKVDIAGAIGALGYQRIVDDCFASPTASICSLITRDPVTNRLSQVRNISQNVAAAAGRGFDVEASYRLPLKLFSDGGNLSLRFFWSRMIENSTTTDRTNAATYFDSSGAFNLPRNTITALQSYDVGRFNLSMSERYLGAGSLSRRYNLPNARPDVADNSVPAVVYVSLSARYALPVGNRGTMEFFANAENLLDQDPPLTPGVFDASLAQTGSQVSSYYDLLGRRFTVGLKFRH